MEYFSTKEVRLFNPSTLDEEEQEKLFKFLTILRKSGIQKFFNSVKGFESGKGGRPSLRDDNLLATIIYGFAFTNGSLRDIESSCKYDLRFIYLMDNEQPKHTAIGDFINNVITPNRNEIFHLITQAILAEFNIYTEDVFIDGTKFEADANKYKFVWKPTTYHIKLCNKVRNLLGRYSLLRGIPNEGIFESSLIADKYNYLIGLGLESNDYLDDVATLYSYLIKSLEYEEKERICGPNRNSYYKTDHDATAICLKEDYYSGLGSNMHAGYNTQILVSKGIIKTYLVTQSRNDYADFIPILKRYFTYYNNYPKIVCADAGYGSFENYKYLKKNNIENYVKYRSWEGNVSGRCPDKYIMNEDHTITCLNGCIGNIDTSITRHPKQKNGKFYRVNCSEECPFKSYCRFKMKDQDSKFRIFEVNEMFFLYKQEAEKNLLSPKGIELRVNRSAQVEGAYGVIKQDMNYTRLRRTTLEKVETEIMLVCLAYNVKKYFSFLSGKAKFDYWKAPDNLNGESFKKPSAKRLSKKSKKQISKNEETKRAYKYAGEK